MPKKAFDYGKTEIYKIIHVDPDINLSYVGHTTNFVQREKNHKYNCVHYGKYYTYANDNNVYGVIRNILPKHSSNCNKNICALVLRKKDFFFQTSLGFKTN